MDQPPPISGADASNVGLAQSTAPTRKRSTSGAGGLLSKFTFMRSSGEHHRPRSRRSTDADESTTSPPTPSFHTIPAETSRDDTANITGPPPLSHAILHHQTQQQQKTRRRRGSLRKVALLGRGAQRERREARGFTVETKVDGSHELLRGGTATTGDIIITASSPLDGDIFFGGTKDGSVEALGLGISDVTPRPSMDGYASRSAATLSSGSRSDITPMTATAPVMASNLRDSSTTDGSSITSPTISYSTTDEEDTPLHMAGSSSRPSTPSVSLSSSSVSLLRPDRASLSSGSESYFPTLPHTHARPLGLSSSSGGPTTTPSIQRRRSTIQRAKSPLALTSLSGLATTPLPPSDKDWDYAETEWWGWVVLVVTWTVFVTGMGSCFGVWSWAWDVGTTPYAPPELEDDPTLPIVGYYPALMILTTVMAWVWVVVAWMGMKYFRHARVSGD
ncbi:hypothetical protein B0H66DRAFT_549121 [Apodospora peruviana]|uniref:Uncharacterized protein n=1 Tax=Apodospora peruviana TaxID=516989 RepID=A0AAE0II80_9PEZI|nr:hypothetical protein B0H66DRAFT_549121 [Apodospora peruviana]